ncbi:hypothetical protein EPA93_45230 [Ktedonosporobacter rubrisoli]|uniref:Prokaryotic glutathione synthetase ATP-binding domain-containing protein n=1 Tax=Ktedonosporobacter rubrisoli TaxID=2509675 RepID=A0A4P6K3L8_KTERU|nr:hypothetical protein [Ktedonosporobacter rubrisoli]QBD82789.1 hypothetical protein EPA93_45230 [Ktedonosporobacter rubrisoli]
MKSLLLASSQGQVNDGQPVAPDDVLLLTTLRRRGITAGVAAWDDPGVERSKAGQVVIRSTWDYYLHLERFLHWAEMVARHSKLCNPLRAVRWNAHKWYLHDLERKSIPIIPTHWLSAGTPTDLAPIMQEHHWQRIMLKPVSRSQCVRCFGRGPGAPRPRPGASEYLARHSCTSISLPAWPTGWPRCWFRAYYKHKHLSHKFRE